VLVSTLQAMQMWASNAQPEKKEWMQQPMATFWHAEHSHLICCKSARPMHAFQAWI